MKRFNNCVHIKNQTEARKFVLTVKKSLALKRIITGLVARIEVSGEVLCGGAAASQNCRAKVANSRSMLPKYIQMNKMEKFKKAR